MDRPVWRQPAACLTSRSSPRPSSLPHAHISCRPVCGACAGLALFPLLAPFFSSPACGGAGWGPSRRACPGPRSGGRFPGFARRFRRRKRPLTLPSPRGRGSSGARFPPLRHGNRGDPRFREGRRLEDRQCYATGRRCVHAVGPRAGASRRRGNARMEAPARGWGGDMGLKQLFFSFYLEIRADSFHLGSYPHAVKKLRASCGVTASMASRIASQSVWTERAAAFFRRALILEKAISMGLKSGL